MCNRARFNGESETILERFGGEWLADKPMDNRFDPKELPRFVGHTSCRTRAAVSGMT